MARARLTVDLDAVVANWRALDALSAPEVETAAVLKADGYGLGAGRVGRALAGAGVRSFFVALAEEGAVLRPALGPGPAIFVLSGLMLGDAALCRAHDLVPCLNSAAQVRAAAAELPGRKCALQLDSGMNRLGLAPDELVAVAETLRGLAPVLAFSHLACAETPDDPYNRMQAHRFAEMLAGLGTMRASLAATAGVLLGGDFHHDMTRPGIGLFGGLPFTAARPVVTLAAPVIQVRTVAPGDSVGYGAAWTASRATRIALVAAGYADGLLRALAASGARAYARGAPCPIVGRVSMDLITVDVTDLPEVPGELELINGQQTIDDLARAAGTIGHEVLTSLGGRYDRVYKEPAQPPDPG